MVSMMAHHVSHIFAFLKKKHNAKMVFDLTIPDVVEQQFEKEDFKYRLWRMC
jgi:hypothetical protein